MDLGFLLDETWCYQKVPQIGNVIIEDYVDIGAATTIDRATLGSTVIKKGVKLDNQFKLLIMLLLEKILSLLHKQALLDQQNWC